MVIICITKEVKLKRRRRIITISLPPEIAIEYEELAKKEAKNKSQLFREMFQVYKRQILEKEFSELQKYGASLARKKGFLTEEDVEKIVFKER